MTHEEILEVRRLVEDAVRGASAANESARYQAQLADLNAAIARLELAGGGYHGQIDAQAEFLHPFKVKWSDAAGEYVIYIPLHETAPKDGVFYYRNGYHALTGISKVDGEPGWYTFGADENATSAYLFVTFKDGVVISAAIQPSEGRAETGTKVANFLLASMSAGTKTVTQIVTSAIIIPDIYYT